ncbi:conserved Mce associated membrane protein [Mycolicibacterium fortuitum]|jgi:Mce-associated membrane protein|uniref:Conserved Mce associated membrane protein n=1 Tax=Mycolicibacterium fortuitum TaxID=1766 RepID=A0A378WEH4_MYCFO|nr:conserved Mce associated membrane protein [Mycolicibacterium fortuitum]
MADDSDATGTVNGSVDVVVDELVVDIDAAADSDEGGEVDIIAGASADAKRSASPLRLALIAGLIGVVVLGGLVGWLGFRTYQSQHAEKERQLFLQVARQGALNLTTIDYQNADSDVQRILDSATGQFHDDFSQRAQPFVDVVKKAQSKSVGTVTDSGLESVTDGEAQAIVAVTVRTSNAGAPEQQPRSWRMRFTMQKVGQDVKVSNVGFVA